MEKAIDRAIESMPEDSVLKPYLEAHMPEVKRMLIEEYNEQKKIALFYKEGLQTGAEEQAKKTAKNLYNMGMKPEDIAAVLEQPQSQVQEWLNIE